MADNVSIKDSTGSAVTVAADQVVDGTLGTVEVQYVKIMDGTLDGTSKAVVTANGLGSEVRAAATTSTTGNVTTSSTSVALDVTIYGHAVAQITGVYAGINVSFEGSVDGGTTYFAVQGARADGTAVETTSGALTNTTRAWEFNVASYTHFRLRSTAFTSGTGAVTIRTSALPTEPVTSSNIVNASLPVTQSGTWTVQPGNTANTTPWLMKQVSSTGTQTSVASSATTVTIVASNANRRGATVFNESTSTLYLKLGATASTTSYSAQLTPNSYYEVPFGYTGVIDGIWSSANGNARVTEIT